MYAKIVMYHKNMSTTFKLQDSQEYPVKEHGNSEWSSPGTRSILPPPPRCEVGEETHCSTPALLETFKSTGKIQSLTQRRLMQETKTHRTKTQRIKLGEPGKGRKEAATTSGGSWSSGGRARGSKPRRSFRPRKARWDRTERGAA